MLTTFSQIFLALFFFTIVLLHLVRKNSSIAALYGIQSLVIVILLVGTYFETGDGWSLLIALLTLVVKVILAPAFIFRLLKKHDLKFLVSSYVNVPLTLVIVTMLTAVAHSNLFAPLVQIIPANQQLLSLALSALFISLFLIANRKGALSQIVGILSLENSIVAFALFAGLEQLPILQVGILFDISIWIAIATVFMSMLYRHFGSLDVSEMKNLTE
ncbi:MAG: hypothetical protein WCT54_00640 [Patescibacteria group bacterium]|jgi:hydrogenase-4 component E